MRHLSLFIMLAGAAYVPARAQSVQDAYRLSALNATGTARSMGFGNTLGSVGGDFASLSVNPAGIGVYRTSEFMFTPSLKINSASTDYTGMNTLDNNVRFNINNFGLVLTDAPKGKRYDRRKWKTVSFGFGMNRVADFNADYTYMGKTATSSASQVFESDANLNKGAALSSDIANTLGYMGYNAYLLNVNGAGQFYSIVPYSGGVDQQKTVHSTGGVTEYALSLGGNYKEKLMLGATIGIPVVRMHTDAYFQESMAAGNTVANPYGFRSFNYEQVVDVNGAGINAKIGAIYKLNDHIRLGAAFHSPTWYALSEVSSPGITTMRNNGGIDSVAILTVENQSLLQNALDYNLTTPWKGILSATLLLNHFGFITADYEYVDYSSMRYVFPDGIDAATGAPLQAEADQMNQQIKKTYKGASNIRIGAEWKVNNVFMVRAGGGYFGNAFTNYGQGSNAATYSTERIDMSLGAGFHFKRFFTDVAVVRSMYQDTQRPYTIDNAGLISGGGNQNVQLAKTDRVLNNVALTLGWKLEDRSPDHQRRRRF